MTMLAEEQLEEVSALDSESIVKIRKLAENDLYFLCKGVLHYPDVNKLTHQEFCRFIVGHPSLRKLFLMPRAHLKSTIATIGDSIRRVLARPEHERILITSETEKQAKKFLKEIKAHFQNNKLLQQLYPELIPETFSGPGSDWSSTEATLNRTAAHKEPHWMASGIGGAFTGGHYTTIKNDDIIGLEAIRSPAKMQEARDFVDALEPFLVDQHVDEIHWCGTRWGRSDVYEYVMSIYGDDLAVFSREAIEDGRIIFPQKHTDVEYTRLMEKQPRVWFAQYCNNPMAASQAEFSVGSLGTYRFHIDGRHLEVISGPRSGQKYVIRDLDIVVTCDPNSGSLLADDEAAIIVSGMAHDGAIFVLHTWSGRENPTVFVDTLFQIAKDWRPRVVGIERAGQQNTDHYFKEKCEKEGEHFRVEDLPPRNKMKEERIRHYLDKPIRSGDVYLLQSQQKLRGQIAQFPNNLMVDELDCFAYGRELWRKPWAPSMIESDNKVIDLVMRRRSPITGY